MCIINVPVSTTEKTLAEKLDEDIDQYIESLPKRPYKDGWPEDRWQEEMEKHPCFMTKPPNEDGELSPLVEGLQQLKYDENENTPEELANTYKDEGNFSFKCKKYREAITNYSAGLKYNCSNELKASLYNNRAAANFFLKNYRSALIDSEQALKFKPDYPKAEIRLAQCYQILEKYENCVEICDKILLRGYNETVATLKKNALNEKKIKERNSRKHKKLEEKEALEEQKLLNSIKSRGIKIVSSSSSTDSSTNSLDVTGVTNLNQLEPYSDDLELKRVHLEGDELVWPVMFLYPIHGIFDCIQEFKENSKFQDHLDETLHEKPEWDAEEKHKPNTVKIYFKNEGNKIFNVETGRTLKEILQHERFVIKNGVPLFYILPQDCKAKDFIGSNK